MSPDKLIHMANQISLFMESRPQHERVAGMAGHLNDFWEPRMRAQFFEMIEAGAPGFRPLVLEAAPRVRRPAA